ncbi:MAG: di-heme oxidoredictase family protein [Bryobacteraceae bacterium]
MRPNANDNVCSIFRAAPAIASLAFAVWFMFPSTGVSQSMNSDPRDPGVRGGPTAPGPPLAGLTVGQQQFFSDGKEAFEEFGFVQNPPPDGDAGLGPGFNANSCAGCHAFPSVGGTSPSVNPQVALATKLGARNVVPPFIRLDGPVLEVRFKQRPDGSHDGGVHNLFSIAGRTDAAGCNAPQEDFSATANLSFRTVTPTFGLGLIEAIDDSHLSENLARDASAKGSLGISGRFNRSENDGTISRFGWKAQNKSLHIFAAEAYNVEMGVSSRLFPQERNESPGCGFNLSPEDSLDFESGDHDDIALFAAFMRFLAPAARGPITASETDGLEAFNRIGCALCHTPALTTGRNGIPALSGKPVPLFSDVALHRMGPGLADDIRQGTAEGDEFRTAPLWGLGQRIFFLHDGRTADLLVAIRAHASEGNRQYRASEANGVIRRFNLLPAAQQQNVLNFLRSL